MSKKAANQYQCRPTERQRKILAQLEDRAKGVTRSMIVKAAIHLLLEQCDTDPDKLWEVIRKAAEASMPAPDPAVVERVMKAAQDQAAARKPQ